MEKAVIYARYSTDKQTYQSIEGQIRDCETFAKNVGLVVINKYIDEAITGKKDTRPDFQRMIKDSEKRLFQYVIVYQLDRFSRDKYDSAHYKHALKKNGVKVLSAKENISDAPEGILMEAMLEGMAQYYSAELSRKVKRGMYESFLKGYVLANAPYGYDAVPVEVGKRAKKHEVNEQEAAIVRGVFNDYAGGKSVLEIKDDLDARKIKNKRGVPFAVNSIINMLNNYRYIGTLTLNGEQKENVIPPIVSRETFDAVQKRLDHNKVRHQHRVHEHFLLTTKTYCAYCKSLVGGETGTSKTGLRHRYYKCYSKKRHRKECDQLVYQKYEFENAVIDAILDMLCKDGMIESIATQLVSYNQQLRQNPDLERYELQLAGVKRKIGGYLEAIEQGIITSDTKSRMLELESEKADLLFKIDKENLALPIQLDYYEVLYWFEQFKDGDATDNEFRERLIDTFVNKIVSYNDYFVIVFNIKGADGSKITIKQILENIEKPSQTLNQKSSSGSHLERAMRIELTHPAWKAGVLPLNYSREFAIIIHQVPIIKNFLSVCYSIFLKLSSPSP